MKSLALLFFNITTGRMNGRAITLNGKNVIVTPPINLSYEILFFSLIMVYLLIASIYAYTALYLLINIAIKTDLSKIWKIII